MTKLSPVSEGYLLAFENAYQAYKEAETSLEARLAAQLEKDLSVLRIAASMAGNQAVVLGSVPISRLGSKDHGRRGMRTKNFNTIKDFLNLTADTALVQGLEQQATEQTQRFVLVTLPEGLTPATVRVTMEGDDWDKFVKQNKHRFRRPQFADETEIVMEVQGGKPWYDGGLGDTDFSTVNMYDHPIMGWLKYGPGKDELAAWLLQHPEAVGEAVAEDDDNEDDYEEDE